MSEYLGNEIMIIRNNARPTPFRRYRYLVLNGPYSLTAFRTKSGLKRWLSDFGLTIRYHSRNSSSVMFTVEGEAIHISVWRGEFEQIDYDETTYRLSNGDYTLNRIVRGSDGITRVYYMNPNEDRDILSDGNHPELLERYMYE